jgi:2-methylisocitrate lyase-like PEP mutase family enzyme
MTAVTIGTGRLDDLWSSDRALLVPGITDMVSVRLARQAGFDTLFLSGYWCAASRFGQPDAGIVGYSQFLDQIRMVLDTEDIDLVADADTGFGSFTNLKVCAEGYERAGVRAIQIEDQKFPKRCAISGASDVVDLDEMLQRIAVVVDARQSAGFRLIARTDAKPEQGLQAAIDRGNVFVEAGADLVFVEGVHTDEELAALHRHIPAPLVYNYTPGSGIPNATPDQIASLGARLVLAPSEAALAGAAAMQQAYRALAQGRFHDMDTLRQIQLEEIGNMLGLDAAKAFEDRHGKS